MTPPNQLRMDDGFSTLITIANIPTVKIYEKEVTPPSFTMGGPIETTTMRNIHVRTSAPRKLKSLGQISTTVAYATESIPIIRAQSGINQLITLTYPDGSQLHFWGWIESFTPGNHTEGNQPTAVMVVHPSNRDADGNEFQPHYIPPSESSGNAA